ncbi:MAG: GspE/PulE family protein, partial [Phycisphaerales bacterium]
RSALDRRASDILIDPRDESSYSVRLRIDGTLRTVEELDADKCRAVINSIKAVSGMDISERRRPQDGGFMARRGSVTASFRVASAGALQGEKLSVRVLNQSAGTLKLADMGLPEKQLAVLRSQIQKPAGMILVCGPTGSGKTTTLYAMLNEIDRFTRNVITVEDPIEAVLPEASQIEVNPKADITFASTLRSVLRQDPDVICVGEIRDEETAEIALRAAQTGHLVMATLHCESNATAIVRLLDLGISPLLLSAGLNLLVSQRLVRCLCEECRTPAKLSDSQILNLRKKGIEPQGIFDAVGCDRCDDTGYFGRTAILDLMAVDDAMRNEIAKNKGESLIGRLRAQDSQKGVTDLRKAGLRKVVAGVTSLEEIKRVVG